MRFFDVLVEELFDGYVYAEPVDPEDPEISDPFAEDSIYAWVEIPYGNPSANKSFFHLTLTEDQMNYRHALDAAAPGGSDPFAKTLAKADKQWTKEVDKTDEDGVLCPLHVFGTSMVDHETGEVLTPDVVPNNTVSGLVWEYVELVVASEKELKTEVNK